MEEFAGRLARWRRLRGLTQERLADASGLSVRGIRELERGRGRAPRPRTAALLAEALRLAGADRAEFLALATRVPPDAGPAPPGELPPAINDLTGRDGELARLAALASPAVNVRRPGPAVVVVHGLTGVGTTSLAISAGHRLRGGFPDGQLFIDLLGGTPKPLDPAVALGRFLRSLGLPDEQIPPTRAGRIALYRTVTHDRRLIVVLDNAADERQVRSLRPVGGGSFVLVTSHRPLAGLEAVERLALGPLTHPAGRALLRIIVGPRAVSEPDAVAELAYLCGNLPLALRIAGNRLASRPSWSVARAVGQLRDEGTRLSTLTAGDQSMAAALAVPYGRLSPAAALALRRCAVLAPADLDAARAALTTGLPEPCATAALEELVDFGLLCPAGERYHYPDLVRLFAAEQPPGWVLPRAVTPVTGTSGYAGQVPGPGVDPVVS
ncbi:helix-turn-helix domain-containing protein [Actinoplanes sp. NPDC049265]|uniref:helix-turn-helix domain-containing protein n=1 Tax=Actinoplanes sp. NPDC049265 TaxID=3363902 RepID=UPI00371E03B2